MKITSIFLVAGILSFVVASCNNSGSNKSSDIKAGVTKTSWGEFDGKKVELFTLVNHEGDTDERMFLSVRSMPAFL